MPHAPSFPLERWRGERRQAIETLAQAHAAMGELDGPGRPLEIGRPVAHAYVLRVVAEFQAFIRDLHDLGSEKVGEMSTPDEAHRALLATAATEGRFIDRGNADLRSMTRDFRRLGVRDLSDQIGNRSKYWTDGPNHRGDRAYYGDLIELRNCLAHGNQDSWTNYGNAECWTPLAGVEIASPGSIEPRTLLIGSCGIIYGKFSMRNHGDVMPDWIKEGAKVFVPWGVADPVPATIVEVWGDPPAHVRVQLHFASEEEGDEDPVILISPDILEAA